MQYGRALECLIREVLISDLELGPVHVLKAYASDGFYCIVLRPTDSPKLGIGFPSEGEDKELLAIMLTLPKGWKKSPPIFCTATETVADLANAALRCNTPTLPHSLDDMAEAIVREEPPTLQPSMAGLTRDPYLRRANSKLDAYIDVFVNNLLGLSLGPAGGRVPGIALVNC